MSNKKDLNFTESIEDRFGDFIVYDESKDKVVSISTGSVSLDSSTGIGGIPLGRFTQIDGMESAGKTTLALSICKSIIEEGHKVLYDDSENTLDFSYARAIIGEFDHSLFTLVQPETAEQALEIAENGIDSGEFQLIVLDSVGALSPEKEKEDDFTDINVALLPRLISKFLRRNAFTVRSKNIAFVFVNQVRAKIGSYVPSFEVPGGHSLKHILSLRIALNRATDIKQGEEIVGINTKFVIRKNKLASPFKSFIIPIMFGQGIDYYRDLINFTEMLGILDKRGPYYTFEGNTLGSGMVNTIEYLKNNKDTLDKLIDVCYNSTNNIKTEIVEE